MFKHIFIDVFDHFYFCLLIRAIDLVSDVHVLDVLVLDRLLVNRVLEKNSLKRSLASCEPSSSDFSLSKCRRLDREGNPLAPLADVTSSHKCAGTQTYDCSFCVFVTTFQV